MICEWDERPNRDWVCVVFYKEILRDKIHPYVKPLMVQGLREYSVFHDAVVVPEAKEHQRCMHGEHKDEGDVEWTHSMASSLDKRGLFDETFRALLLKSEELGPVTPPAAATTTRVPHEEETNYDVEDSSDDETPDSGELTEKQRLLNIRKLKTRLSNKPSKKESQKNQQPNYNVNRNMSKSDLATLDKSKGSSNNDTMSSIDAVTSENSSALQEARAAYLPQTNEQMAWEEQDENITDDDLHLSLSSSKGKGGMLSDWYDRFTGNKILTAEDITPVLESMRTTLVGANVAEPTVVEILDSVRQSLLGQQLSSLRVKTMVRQALERVIGRMLSTSAQVDILRDVLTKRDSGTKTTRANPYVIVMVGINGVGKSTSLAKIAYYLKSRGCSPLLAACDTFRSGAVEQLAVHAKCLDVPLFQKGYAKDPASVASAAIAHAKEKGNDVVLVDTAGRMQNNKPLMNALAKLVEENDPDLVCFVGEALVGNDGIDQLKMFDSALSTRSGASSGKTRRVDGIVLTKYDTVSDKVGAALTMTHITGAPILFVGVGQKYNHLTRLSVAGVIKSLFK